MARGKPLVRLAHAGGVAAVVRRPDGGVWLVDDLDRGMATGVDHRAAVCGIGPALTLAGGRAPAGAVRAIVRDRAGREHDAVMGEGAWLALLEQPILGESPVVRFLDGAGDVVAVGVPAGVALAPVGDAEDPCPVCRAVAWDRVVAAPEGLYGSDGAGRPTAAVCRRCGHEESLGAMYAVASSDPEPDPAAVAALQARIERDSAATASRARFARYGLAGHAHAVRGYGTCGDEVDSVTLAFATVGGPVWVETSAEEVWEPPAWIARGALEGLLHERDEGAWPERSDTALALALNARERVHAADAAAAPARELQLPVAGTPTGFATVVHGDRFAAAARIGDLTVTITGRGAPDGLVLEPVA